ncbi:galectin-4 isoform X3 [Peromyscus californicus insignis]|uniref:galectin-4 isoform X3 n=1 Tax=Peromyscus californicus insignis TaxID=564181 RepID=UPI0022A7704C|nr:galectin-4 isoform X3 [Peromyscus californicus insignis]
MMTVSSKLRFLLMQQLRGTTQLYGNVSLRSLSSSAQEALKRAPEVSSDHNYESIQVTSAQKHVLHVQLSRPEKRNAMNRAFWRELVECFQKISEDSDCRAVVISGAGKMFTSGIDIIDMASLLQPPGDDVARMAWYLRDLISKYQKTFTVIEKCPKPVIAAIHGGCVGAGVDLISACDIRYCAQDAFFQVKEVDIGLAADVGTLQRLPKVIGNQSLVNELTFTARKMMADEALDSGLVSRVFPDKDVMLNAAFALAAEISSKSPVAVQGSKINLIYSRDHSVDESLDYMDKLSAQTLKMAFVPAPGYQPTYNPTLPYKRPIPGGLNVGMSVYVQGVAKENMKRFRVDFTVGQDEGADIAFHFNPRFDGWDKVVFNTKQNGQWGKEEKKMSMPFSKGSHFELVFMVMSDYYKVVVNGNPFYEYRHRLPLQMVNHLHVDGDLELQSINFLGGQSAPAPYPGHMASSPHPGPGYYPPQMNSLPVMAGPPTFNPPVPYVGTLHGGLIARRTIIVKGYILPTAKNFIINFKVGSSGDIALHINPRMGEGVVRNSFMNGSWGSEERKIGYNPFGPGQFFDLSIRCGTDRFKVFANGQHLFDYSHRFQAFQRIDMLEIKGDITLSYVQI